MANQHPFLALLAGIALFPTGGGAEPIEKTYPLTGFERLNVAGVYDVTVVVGRPYSVTISGDPAELARVTADVRRQTLVLGFQSRGFHPARRKRQSLDAHITLPSLVGIESSGVVDGRVKGIRASDFEVELSGVGELDLEGTCERLHAAVSGVGSLDADGLKCAVVRVSVSGVGEASVFASDAVDASVSGMGEIAVDGSPKKIKKSGGLFAEISVK